MPMNCWRTDSRIPVHTTGDSPIARARRLRHVAARSLLSVRLISRSLTGASSEPMIRSRTSLASAIVPRAIRWRGDSGMRSTIVVCAVLYACAAAPTVSRVGIYPPLCSARLSPVRRSLKSVRGVRE